ncbi:MAG: hypothetical protein IJS47_05950 [Clostridia bacterium]|nr:hypothetical protein [Clostridia bacterium]
MSKTTATLFTEFEKDLLKNMQELEISKPQKEYVLKNINIPFSKWLYSDTTNSSKETPYATLNTNYNKGTVVFPKLHINLNKTQNTFVSKYNLYEITAKNHPMVDDSIKLLKNLSKKIPCSKNNTLLGQTKATLTEEMFFEDATYLDYLTNLMLTLNLIERHTKKTSRYDSIKISEAGKEYLTLSKEAKFAALKKAAISYASYQLKTALISKADMLATLIERTNEKANEKVSLDFFSEERLTSLLTAKTVNLEAYYDEIFSSMGIDRKKYVNYFNSKASKVNSMEAAFEDEKLFLAIYVMDIQNMFDTYFVNPFSYYFMTLVPTYSAQFNCQSTIMEMLLAKENKRMCEHLSYSVPIALTATPIANM